jgi:hypothetical protein
MPQAALRSPDGQGAGALKGHAAWSDLVRTSLASCSGMSDARKNAHASMLCSHPAVHLPVPQQQFIGTAGIAVIPI